jgi:8-oxo-dGTP diphosphatase
MVKREYPDTPLVAVGAIIIENERVLLIKRAKAPLLGEWSLPGGLLELGETLRQGAVREALEETGLLIQTADLLGVFDRVVRDADERILYHYVLIDFLCHRKSGESRAAGDAAEARWFTSSELPALALAADTLKVIEAGFEKSAHEPDH